MVTSILSAKRTRRHSIVNVVIRATPFEITLPPETIEAINEIESGGGTRYSSIQEMMNDPDLQ